MKSFYGNWFLMVVVLFSVEACAQPAQVSPDAMHREIGILRDALYSLHPGVFRYSTKAQLDRLFNLYQRRVRRPMSMGDYYILLSQLLVNVHCGHTYLNPWNQTDSIKKTLLSEPVLPVLFRIIGQKCIITHNLSADRRIEPGDQVVSINGVASKKIIHQLLSVSRSDGLGQSPKKQYNLNIDPLGIGTNDYTLFDTYLSLFYPGFKSITSFRLVIRPFSGKRYVVSVAPMTKPQRADAYSRRFGQVPTRENGWSLTIKDGAVACLKMADFETWEWKTDYKLWLDSVFRLIRNSSIHTLIIHIRGNEGGADAARDELLSYLLDKPFGCLGRQRRLFRFLQIPDSLKPFIRTYDKSLTTPKSVTDVEPATGGLYEAKADLLDTCMPVMPKADRFTGQEYLVVDGANSSTTFTLADLFQQYHAGEIVGEQTSGNKQGINGGQFFFFYLPISKLEFDIPLIWGAPSTDRPEGGVTPDLIIKTTQASIYRQQDPQIEAILNMKKNPEKIP